MRASHFSSDIQDFILWLWRHKVRYVIVGGEAVIYHGFARLTGDVDFLFERTSGNVQRLYRALADFFQGDIPGVKDPGDLMGPDAVIQFGVPPNRIDLVSSITGVSFEKAWESRVRERIKIRRRLCRVYFIGLKELIRNKQAVGRHKDLEDLKYLRAAARKR